MSRIKLNVIVFLIRNSTSIIPDGSNDIESVESSDTVGSDEIS
jgi:hypothetical protein